MSTKNFTGLTDIDGKNIYEGTHLKLTIKGAGSGVVKVVFHNGMFQLFSETEGYYPLEKALKNNNFIIDVYENT
jgi:hypothetical protein